MPDEKSPLQQADKATAHRLDLIAATEAATAYEDEFRDQTDRMARTTRDRSWLPLVVKMWDGSLDRRRCSACSSANLEVRPLGLSFSIGEPGHAHPRCRCVCVLIVLPVPYDANK